MTLSNVFRLIAGKAQLLSLQAPGAAPEEWAVLLCHDVIPSMHFSVFSLQF